MKSLLNNFCKYTVAMAVLVILCPQATWAGGTSKHNHSSNVIAAPNGNTGINGTGLPQPGSKWLKRVQKDKKVIAAPNGNTGINGTGLPQPGSKRLKRVQKEKKVIAASNGNTGIAGTGLSQPGSKQNHMQKTGIYGTVLQETWFTPTGTSSLEDFILWKIKNKSNQKKSGDAKKGPTQADLDAQAAVKTAAQAYDAAGKATSVARTNLESAKSNVDRANKQFSEAFRVWQAAGSGVGPEMAAYNKAGEAIVDAQKVAADAANNYKNATANYGTATTNLDNANKALRATEGSTGGTSSNMPLGTP